MSDTEDYLPEPSNDDQNRIRELLLKIGGPGVSWGAVNVLDVLLTEHRVRSERRATGRLSRATWALAAATVVLALATVGLIVATVANG